MKEARQEAAYPAKKGPSHLSLFIDGDDQLSNTAALRQDALIRLVLPISTGHFY